jgi:alginate O-acetyltransferase complex protein AlgJ
MSVPARQSCRAARPTTAAAVILIAVAAAAAQSPKADMKAPERLVVDARLVETVAIPEPAAILPYKNALAAYVYQVETVVSGKPPGRRILAARYAIRESVVLEHVRALRRGQTSRLDLVPFDSVRELAREKLITAGEDVTLPLFYQADAASEQVRAGLGALAAGGQAVVRGADGFLFLRADLRSLSVGPFWGDHAAAVASSKVDPDPLPAIVDFAAQLKSRGVELVLVGVPPKPCVYADKLSAGWSGAGRPDEHHRGFYDLLEKQGITVLDVRADLLKLRRSGTAAYCKTDTHWSPAAVRVVADRIAEHVRSRPFFRQLPLRAQSTGIEKVEEAVRGDLAAMAQAPAGPTETIVLERVRLNERGRAEADPGSPLVLAGDSHVLVYHDGLLGRHAGLVDHLTGNLAVAVDLVGVLGSGANGPRIALARRKDNLAGKKCVVWCFAARELTESDQGWKRIPTVR